MRGLEQVVASALLKSCMLGEECVILLFQKEYAGLRVKKALPPSWPPALHVIFGIYTNKMVRNLSGVT